MKKNIVSFVLAFLCSLSSYSFENYLPGWVVTSKGDTISGWIDYKDWVKNPTFVFFKIKETGEKEKFLPTQIKSFGVNNSIYESNTVEVNMASRDLAKLEHDSRPKMEEKRVFLKLLFRGRLDLYKLTIRDREDHYFLQKGEDIPQELIYHVYLDEVTPYNTKQNTSYMTVKRVNEKYKGQLRVFMRDCEQIKSSQIDALSYQEKSLFYIVKKYHQACERTPIEYATQIKRIKTEIGIYLGGAFTSFNAKSDHEGWRFLSDGDIKPRLSPVGGLFIEVIFPGSHESLSLYNELGFSMLRASSSYEGFSTTGWDDISYEGSFSISYVGLTSKVRKYINPKKPTKFYFELGMLGRLAIHDELSMVETKSTGTKPVREYPALDEIRRFQYGAEGGLGLKSKRYSLGLNLYGDTGFSSYNFLSTISYGISLKGSCKF